MNIKTTKFHPANIFRLCKYYHHENFNLENSMLYRMTVFRGFRYNSGIFPVGVIIHTRAVECYKDAHSRSLPCCTLARKADQRLVLCIPVLLLCPVVESISSGKQPCMKGKWVTTLSNEFCAVQILKRWLFGLWNSGMSTFQGLQCMPVNGNVICTGENVC